MDKELIACDRPGIDPKWPKPKSIELRLKKAPPWIVQMALEAIEDYVSRADCDASRELPNKRNVTNFEAGSLGARQSFQILDGAPQQSDWLSRLAAWARYHEVGLRHEYFWHCQYREFFPDRPRGLMMFNLSESAAMMGVFALLGWREQVTYSGYLCHAAVNQGFQLALQYRDEHKRAQIFMLQLFADWKGDASHAWPSYASAEPIYQHLLANWRTPDASLLIPCLLAACDRHTHQCGNDTLSRFYEFNSDIGLQRVPVEILFLLRLREWEGLVNPTIDHPLMSAPFNVLAAEQPIPPLDELMAGSLRRAQTDWPQYDDVVSMASVRTLAKSTVAP